MPSANESKDYQSESKNYRDVEIMRIARRYLEDFLSRGDEELANELIRWMERRLAELDLHEIRQNVISVEESSSDRMLQNYSFSDSSNTSNGVQDLISNNTSDTSSNSMQLINCQCGSSFLIKMTITSCSENTSSPSDYHSETAVERRNSPTSTAASSEEHNTEDTQPHYQQSEESYSINGLQNGNRKSNKRKAVNPVRLNASVLNSTCANPTISCHQEATTYSSLNHNSINNNGGVVSLTNGLANGSNQTNNSLLQNQQNYMTIKKEEGLSPRSTPPAAISTSRRSNLRYNSDSFRDNRLALEYITPEGKRHFRCPVCLNNYANRSGLNRHYITHSPDDMWKAECHICGKKYSRKDSLKHHIKTQHNNDDLFESTPSKVAKVQEELQLPDKNDDSDSENSKSPSSKK